jgi:Spy/CpxP family protein refolding chaperone
MTRKIVIAGFLVAFAAGLVAGIESFRVTGRRATQTGRHSGWLSAELKLTPEQRDQLEKIWSETARRGGGEREELRRQLYRERDEAIAEMIRPEDKPRYEEILKKHSEKMAALDGEWHSSYQTAVDRTRQILTPEQRTRYEELLQHRQKERGSRDWHRGERERETGRSGGGSATSRCASQP